MSTFIRRPFLASQTDAFILSQPVINGTVHINNNGSFDDIDSRLDGRDFEIRFETDEGTVDVEFSAPVTLTLSEIVAGINTAADAASVGLTAYAEYGVLQVRSDNSGYQASASTPTLTFIRVLAADSGYEDLAPLLGFAVYPHPAATVTAGDLASASPRALT